MENYGLKTKNKYLIDKLNLNDKKVILTIGRIDKGLIDYRKGFDEIIEVLPELRKIIPDIFYLIIGDGDDIKRLKKKAKNLKVNDIVSFIGYIEEQDKPKYIRLADVYAMPGSSKIFDRYPFRFVFLEALACGVPVVGSELTDLDEKQDEDAAKLIIQVNPNNKNSIIQGICKGIKKPKSINPNLNNYEYEKFKNKLHDYLDLIYY